MLKPVKSKIGKIIFRVAISLTIIYLLFWVGIIYFQTYLIFPGQLNKYATIDIDKLEGVESIKLQTANGEIVYGLFGKALTGEGKLKPTEQSLPTILYFYGNDSNLRKSLREFNDFRKLGVNVFIPEYVGYGISSGVPSEANCYATADVAYQYLLHRSDIDHSKIIVAGWSLGSGVAIDLASRNNVAGVAVFSAYTSITSAAARLLPIFPINRSLQYNFDSLSKIKLVKAPILFIHGKADLKIPYQMSEILATKANTRVEKYFIDNARHNKIFVYVESLVEIDKFIMSL